MNRILPLNSLEVTITVENGKETVTADGYALFYDDFKKEIFVARQYGQTFGEWYPEKEVRIKPPLHYYPWVGGGSTLPYAYPPFKATPWQGIDPSGPFINSVDPVPVNAEPTCGKGGCGR